MSCFTIYHAMVTEEVPSDPSWSTTVLLSYFGSRRATSYLLSYAVLCGYLLVIGSIRSRTCWAGGICTEQVMLKPRLLFQTSRICGIPVADLILRLSIFDLNSRLVIGPAGEHGCFVFVSDDISVQQPRSFKPTSY